MAYFGNKKQKFLKIKIKAMKAILNLMIVMHNEAND
jgi:hypothetical protein